MASNQTSIIDFDQGWEIMQSGITKLKNILEGNSETQFNSEEYMILYETIYRMCKQEPPHDYSQRLYDKYRETFEEYITSTVFPCLRGKRDEFMLRELVKRWSNHKIMVYQEVKTKVRDAVISLIDQEREGQQIDRALLKNVTDIFVEIGMGKMDYYENDFEAAMLNDTAAYYSRKASSWILQDPQTDYMMELAEECLRSEKNRVPHYLHPSSEAKLLEVVRENLAAPLPRN